MGKGVNADVALGQVLPEPVEIFVHLKSRGLVARLNILGAVTSRGLFAVVVDLASLLPQSLRNVPQHA